MLQGKIRTGELDRKVTFIKENVSRGASNQDIITWGVIASNPTVFSRKLELKGNEVVINDQLKYVQKTLFTIRFREDLTTKNRVVFEGRVYEIVSITENGLERKAYLDVVANLIDNETWS